MLIGLSPPSPSAEPDGGRISPWLKGLGRPGCGAAMACIGTGMKNAPVHPAVAPCMASAMLFALAFARRRARSSADGVGFGSESGPHSSGRSGSEHGLGTARTYEAGRAIRLEGCQASNPSILPSGTTETPKQTWPTGCVPPSRWHLSASEVSTRADPRYVPLAQIRPG